MFLGRNKLIVIIFFWLFWTMGRNKTNLKVGLYLTGNLEIWYQLIVNATRSSVRCDNLIEWRSRRWWSKAPSKRFLAITTPRLHWLSPMTHEWPRHEGLSLQAQSRTQARTGKKRNQNCIDHGMGSHKLMTATPFDDRIDLSKTRT
jgi:hypothetical protein